jgi:hypothetical protein
MRRHHDISDEAEINITPMLDIVFIMLIFFIVTTSFVKEFGIDMSRHRRCWTNICQRPADGYSRRAREYRKRACFDAGCLGRRRRIPEF